jgi:hypothetical protein
MNSRKKLISRRGLSLSVIAGLILAVLTIFIFFMFLPPPQPTQSQQLQSLEKEANNEVTLIMGKNQYVKQNSGSTCWSFGNKNDSDRGRSCSLGFQLHSNVPKSEITRLIISHGWQKQIFSKGTKVEHSVFIKESAECSITDNDVLIQPQADGSLVKINDYYTFSCMSITHDTSLHSLFSSNSD